MNTVKNFNTFIAKMQDAPLKIDNPVSKSKISILSKFMFSEIKICSFQISLFECHISNSLVVERRTPEREVGGSILTQVVVLLLEQDTFTSQKVLVIPRKRWLRPDMTEKLLTGT